ncbi:MAG TPA: aspartate-semialdehyde dehydrogenase [Steroidobacteraceae bacterium]|nr:aspartate-semialdehyde dehydrogenase [Steroidobacteraceae bacterium]
MSAAAHQPRIAVVGAGGLIGEALVAELQLRGLGGSRLHALDDLRDLGRVSADGSGQLAIGDVAAFDFSRVELAFFCARSSTAQRFAPAAAAHALVIDSSSAHRESAGVPLVVADVNPGALEAIGARGLVALPCSASVALATAVAPLAALAGLERVDVATYHAVSGSGRAAVDGLAAETAALLGGRSPRPRTFGTQIAFNVLPLVDALGGDGSSAEERRLASETRRVLGLPGLQINATAVRVPVFFGHGLAVHALLERTFDLAEVAAVLRRSNGIRLVESAVSVAPPTPAGSALAPDHVYVGRLRADASRDRSLNFWVVADNVRKCAAHNAVSVAQILVNRPQ